MHISPHSITWELGWLPSPGFHCPWTKLWFVQCTAVYQ